MRYGVQYSVGAPKIFFFFLSIQNFLCTKGCLKPVEGIKKVFNIGEILQFILGEIEYTFLTVFLNRCIPFCRKQLSLCLLVLI